MSVKEKFLDYVRFDTQSDETSATIPSTEKQKTLGAVSYTHLDVYKRQPLHRNVQLRYEHSNWCRWPDSNRHGVATGGF